MQSKAIRRSKTIDAETNPGVSGNQISGVKTRYAFHIPFVPSASDSSDDASRIVSLEARDHVESQSPAHIENLRSRLTPKMQEWQCDNKEFLRHLS